MALRPQMFHLCQQGLVSAIRSCWVCHNLPHVSRKTNWQLDIARIPSLTRPVVGITSATMEDSFERGWMPEHFVCVRQQMPLDLIVLYYFLVVLIGSVVIVVIVAIVAIVVIVLSYFGYQPGPKRPPLLADPGNLGATCWVHQRNGPAMATLISECSDTQTK